MRGTCRLVACATATQVAPQLCQGLLFDFAHLPVGKTHDLADFSIAKPSAPRKQTVNGGLDSFASTGILCSRHGARIARKPPTRSRYPHCLLALPPVFACPRENLWGGIWGLSRGKIARSVSIWLRRSHRVSREGGFPKSFQQKAPLGKEGLSNWVQGLDLNQRPSGYEPDKCILITND